MKNNEEKPLQNQIENNADTDSMNDSEQLELVCWLIDRYDTQRSAVASRAATVVSGNTLLLGGIAIVLGNLLSGTSKYTNLQKVVLSLFSTINVLAIATSMLFAISATSFIWKNYQQALKTDKTKQILFFRARDTLRNYRNSDSFSMAFRAASKKQMIEYALRELLVSTDSQLMRYENFRRALQALFISVILFCVLIILVLLFSIGSKS